MAARRWVSCASVVTTGRCPWILKDIADCARAAKAVEASAAAIVVEPRWARAAGARRRTRVEIADAVGGRVKIPRRRRYPLGHGRFPRARSARTRSLDRHAGYGGSMRHVTAFESGADGRDVACGAGPEATSRAMVRCAGPACRSLCCEVSSKVEFSPLVRRKKVQSFFATCGGIGSMRRPPRRIAL